jgi:hypothetical protein
MTQKLSIKPQKISVTLLASGLLAAVVAVLFVALPARAECEYAGRKYQTDETTGSLRCMADGTMQ